jgi:hypothetical protein
MPEVFEFAFAADDEEVSRFGPPRETITIAGRSNRS